MPGPRTIHSRLIQGLFSFVKGIPGLVPAPGVGDDSKFLRGDGSWQDAGEGVTKEVNYQPQYSASSGTYRIRTLTAAAAFEFTGSVPVDFTALVSIEAIYMNLNADVGAGADIDLNSEYGTVGEAKNAHVETDTTTTYTIVATNEKGALDLSSVFSSLSAGDSFGIEIDHMGIGGALQYISIRLRYT